MYEVSVDLHVRRHGATIWRQYIDRDTKTTLWRRLVGEQRTNAGIAIKKNHNNQNKNNVTSLRIGFSIKCQTHTVRKEIKKITKKEKRNKF